jgi:D-alanyl-D-alanine dipeptidase
LRYASSNNFVGENVYGVFNRAFLHRVAADKLARAMEGLERRHLGYRLLIYDALRPRSVQRILWGRVKGTAQQRYVANPANRSLHTFGFAVDLSLLDPQGREVDMGTGFDDFTPAAQPRQEGRILQKRRLTEERVGNRRILRETMEEAGFLQPPIEWWHFDALPAAQVKANYTLVE